MSPATLATTPALGAYESLAFAYDAFTAGHDHERWLDRLERRARLHGLRGRRVLDLACGTGKSFAPMLARGYDVTACDLSPAMVARAVHRHPAGAERVFVADVRDLPDVGEFDLVTCLDDALNYLLDDGDLALALTEAGRALAPGGLLVFDLNTRATFAESFGGAFAFAHGDLAFRWSGEGCVAGDAHAGGIHRAAIEVRAEDGAVLASSEHVQRHHPPTTVLDALDEADLELVAVLGQRTGARLSRDADEDSAQKLVYFARRPGDGPAAMTPRGGIA